MQPAGIYDLTIVGAGFAGLRCAAVAARRGLRVAVLDRKPAPGTRLHTTGIFVQEAVDELDFPARLSRKVFGVRLYAPNGTSTALSSPGYAFHATDTRGLLQWMCEEAIRAGADVTFNTAFHGVDRVAGGFTLRGTQIKTRFLVGADGARSPVAAALGLSRNRHALKGVEVGITHQDGVDQAALHCFLGRKVAPGYIAWAVPGPHHMQIGLAVSRQHTPNIGATLNAVCAHMGIIDPEIIERRAGLIPCGGRLRRISAPRALLIGDAAGLVSPLTAGGILPALQSGRLAGIAIAHYLLDEGPEPSRVMTQALPRFRLKRLQRQLMDLGIPDLVWNWGLGAVPMQALARWLYFHRRTPGPRLERTGLDLLREADLTTRGLSRRS